MDTSKYIQPPRIYHTGGMSTLDMPIPVKCTDCGAVYVGDNYRQHICPTPSHTKESK